MTLKLTREMRLYLLGALAAGVVAVVITIIVMAGHGRPAPPQPESVDLAKSLSSLDISSFEIPKSYREVWTLKWYPSRKQEKQWSWNEVERFWIDPRKSLLASITKENDAKMKELFKGVQ